MSMLKEKCSVLVCKKVAYLTFAGIALSNKFRNFVPKLTQQVKPYEFLRIKIVIFVGL